MHRVAITRDDNDLKALQSAPPFTFIASVLRGTPETTWLGFTPRPQSDTTLLAAAGAMAIVGRLELDELWLPHLTDPRLEGIFTKVVNYFSQKSKKPHSVRVRFYAGRPSRVSSAPFPVADGLGGLNEAFLDIELTHPIVLMGGGTDSCGIYAYYAKKGLKPVGLYYEYGQAAKSYERKAIFDLAQHFNSNAVRVPITLSSLRRELNKYPNISMEGAFPARNWIFYLSTLCMLKELGGNEIAVSVFKGEFDDNHPDHSPITLQDFQDMVDVYVGSGKCKVVVPMRDLDKSDAVFWYKEKIEPEWPIDRTRSCYGMFGRIDGACTGCMNKFVSMAYAGYDMGKTQFFDSDWKTSNGIKRGSRIDPRAATKYFYKYFKRALAGSNYNETRNAEIMWVMQNYPPNHKNTQAELKMLESANQDRIHALRKIAEEVRAKRDANQIEKWMDFARTQPLITGAIA